MKLLHRTLNHLRALVRRRKLDDDMAEELRLHLEQRTDEAIAAGLSPGEARHAAQRRFGGVEQVKEQCRDQRRWIRLEQWTQDLRFAARSLFKSPGFTVIAILTLALGIGLNSSMFSLANAVLLRPLPFPDPGQLVTLYRTTPQYDKGGFARADLFDLQREEARFGRFAGYYFSSVGVAEPGRPPEWQNTLRVSAAFFEVLKLSPQLGRTFRPEEELHGRHRVLVISHALWQDRFGGAADIVGRTLRCDGEPYEIIGVLPASAHDQRIFGNARMFRPLGFTDNERANRGTAFMNLLGRRDPALSVTQGEAFIAAFGARLAADFPKEHARSGWRSVGLQSSLRKPAVTALVLMLLCLSGSVLLIACSNLANFLLARAIARTRESAVRTALGASPAQLIRPLFLEALLIVLLGGLGALLVMGWTMTWFNAAIVRTGDSPVVHALDWRVLGFSLSVSVLTILFFGLAPALFTTRIDPNRALKSGAHAATPGRGHRRFRQSLIVGQFALATVLVAGAGFFVSGADHLVRQSNGWDADHVVQGYMQLPRNRYPSGTRVAALQGQALERLQHLPGVTAASLSYGLPYRGLSATRRYLVEGGESGSVDQGLSADVNGVSPAYFDVTGTRLSRGRGFHATDTATSPRVAIVSDSMARALFPGGDPLGRRVAVGGVQPPEWLEIVGIVADVRAVNLNRTPTSFQLYEPLAQDDWHNGDGKLAELYVAVRTTGLSPEAAVAAVQAAIMAIDPDLPVRGLMPATALVERTTGSIILIRQLLIGFALLGLLLAVLGLYGVIARTVAQRTSEIGLRMALGAQVNDVMRLILGSGIRLAMGGAALGLLGALGLARLIASIFPILQTSPGLVLAATTGFLGAIAFLACYLPARKASRINPLVALRTE